MVKFLKYFYRAGTGEKKKASPLLKNISYGGYFSPWIFNFTTFWLSCLLSEKKISLSFKVKSKIYDIQNKIQSEVLTVIPEAIKKLHTILIRDINIYICVCVCVIQSASI